MTTMKHVHGTNMATHIDKLEAIAAKMPFHGRAPDDDQLLEMARGTRTLLSTRLSRAPHQHPRRALQGI